MTRLRGTTVEYVHNAGGNIKKQNSYENVYGCSAERKVRGTSRTMSREFYSS